MKIYLTLSILVLLGVPFSAKASRKQDNEFINAEGESRNSYHDSEALPGRRIYENRALVDSPTLPDFSNRDLLLSADVTYRQLKSVESQENSHYSNIMIALDFRNRLLSYYSTPWSNSKSSEDSEKKSSVHVVYDIKNQYKFIMQDDTCRTTRTKQYVPNIELPDKSGRIDLTSPYMLFPYDEFEFLKEEIIRGMKVNTFGMEIESYLIEKDGEFIVVPKAHCTLSYLKDGESTDNEAYTWNALIRIQHVLQDEKGKTQEILTLDVNRYLTTIDDRHSLFDLRRCFRKDDYLWVVIGFNLGKDEVRKVAGHMPGIQYDIMKEIEMMTELNPVRIPTMLTNLRDDGFDVIMHIWRKPSLQFDFPTGWSPKTISYPGESQGVSVFDECATYCLEETEWCWGFSMCGNVCYFPSEKSEAIESSSSECSLYRRYSNETYMPSAESEAKILKRAVEAGVFGILYRVIDSDSNVVVMDLTASFIQITSADKNDNFGNRVDPRLRVSRVGYKLKMGAGVQTLGGLSYSECQKQCLDFRDCETVSYCLKSEECLISAKFDSDIPDAEKVADNRCNILARKYSDHFKRSPGISTSKTAMVVKGQGFLEKCAQACLTETGFRCLSFHHCPQATNQECRLHKEMEDRPSNDEEMEVEESRICGHYSRKSTAKFKQHNNVKTLGTTVSPIYDVTLEGCSDICLDYGKGKCYGFDYCQATAQNHTACILLDSDPSRLKTAYSPVCTNYLLY